MRVARLLIALFSVIWLGLLLAAPAAALGVPAAGAAYLAGSRICHQRPDRSFRRGAAQFPVCSRCLGLYAGFAAAAVAAWRYGAAPERGTRTGARRPDLARAQLRTAVLVGALPTAVTWSLEATGLYAVGNAARFAAALPLGAAVALTVNYLECARTRPKGSRPLPTPT